LAMRRRVALETVLADFDASVSKERVDAETARRQLIDQLRAGQLSRKQLAVLARAIAAWLGKVETAIQDARATCEANARLAEEWLKKGAYATEQGDHYMATAALSRADEIRGAGDVALQEMLELHDQLYELGRVVLERSSDR